MTENELQVLAEANITRAQLNKTPLTAQRAQEVLSSIAASMIIAATQGKRIVTDPLTALIGAE